MKLHKSNKDEYMKRSKLIFTVIISFVIVLLTGCLPDSYFEDWEEYEGYAVTSTVTSARTNETTQKLNDFVITDNIPDGECIAVLYKHTLGSSNNPYCRVTVYEPYTNPDEGYVDDYKETMSQTFNITKNTRFAYQGLILYVDDQYCYVINDFYKYGYKEHTQTRPKAQYYIEVSISGMRDLYFYMDMVTSSHPLSHN